MNHERVIAYVDGFNLYFGLKSQRLERAYWLDIPGLLARFLGPGQRLIETKYFTSRISGPPDKAKRQTTYLEALATLPGVTMFFGHYQADARRCRKCGETWHENREKTTDVQIAVELLKDAMSDRLDVSYIVSADSDLVPPIRAFRELWPAKRIVAIFPPGRGSVQVDAAVHAKRRIRSSAALACQMPDVVPGADGYPKRRPMDWM
ncbi:MAG: NYN domain-containing protein [Phycisphaerales bacterium]|nr:NYN domain-containing protein [Phycisphaerales bacterium]